MAAADLAGSTIAICLLVLVACTPSTAPAAPQSAGSNAPAATAGTTVSAPAAAARSRLPDQIAVALPVLAQTQLLYFLAREQGYYEEEGLSVELPIVAPNFGVQGLLGGSYAFSGSGAQAAIASLTGAPLRVIFNQNSTVTWWLMAGPQANVRTIPELRGKTIGVEGPGTLSSTLTRAVLRKHGLNPDTDVQFVSLGVVSNWLPPVISQAVDAGIAADPEPYIIGRQQGLVEVFWYGSELRASLSGLATSEAMLREQPALVRRFLRASIKGLRYYKAHRDESIALAARLSEQSPERVAAAYDLVEPLLLNDPVLDEDVQRGFLALAQEMLRIERPVPPDAVYQYDLTRQAIRELAAERWSPR